MRLHQGTSLYDWANFSRWSKVEHYPCFTDKITSCVPTSSRFRIVTHSIVHCHQFSTIWTLSLVESEILMHSFFIEDIFWYNNNFILIFLFNFKISFLNLHTTIQIQLKILDKIALFDDTPTWQYRIKVHSP